MTAMATKKPANQTTKSTPRKTATAAAGPGGTEATPSTPPKPEAGAEEAITVTVREPMLKKKELIDRVVEATGAKRKDAKSVVEATLKVLGDALSAGEGLALPPLGKAKINRQKDLASGEMLIIKLRRGGPGESAPSDVDEALAKDDD